MSYKKHFQNTINQSETTYSYKCLTVNEETGLLRLDNTEIILPSEQAELIGAYIYLTNKGHRKFSNSTLVYLTSFTNQKIYALTAKIRANLANIDIVDGVSAQSLMLKDIMRELITKDEQAQGLEKRANSLNTDLIDLIDEYGFDIPKDKLDHIRTECILDVSRTGRNSAIFKNNLGPVLFSR